MAHAGFRRTPSPATAGFSRSPSIDGSRSRRCSSSSLSGLPRSSTTAGRGTRARRRERERTPAWGCASAPFGRRRGRARHVSTSCAGSRTTCCRPNGCSRSDPDSRSIGNRAHRMARLLSIVVATCVVAAVPGAGATYSSTLSVRHTGAAADSVATMLRDAAHTGTLSGLRWPRFPYYRDELTGLYSGTSWQPVWSQGGRPTPVARSAVDVLSNVSERGLHPGDYDAALLNRRLQALASAPSPAARDIGWFDVALSIGVLRHVSDVHIGRVNPKTLAVGINIEPKKLDLPRVLRDAIDRGRVAELVRDAEPSFVQYRNLKVAYARYRALAADSTMPTVTAARVVRRGDAFAAVDALRRRLVALGDLSPRAGAAGAAG